MKRNRKDIWEKKFRRICKESDAYEDMLDHRNDDVEWISTYTIYRLDEEPRVVRRHRVGYPCFGIAWEMFPRTYKVLQGKIVGHYCNHPGPSRRKKAYKKAEMGGHRRNDRNILNNLKYMTTEQILDTDYIMSNYRLNPWNWD